MIRRTVFGLAAAAGLSLLFFGRDAVSYVCTSAGRVKESVKNSVPVEFEIDRARRMVGDLVPDIRRNMHVIAKEEVEIERLQKEITDTSGRLDKQRGDLVRLKTDLQQDKGTYQYVGRTYTTDQVKTDLATRFERFKTSEATLASLRDIYSARQKSLEAARQKLEGMVASKRQLEVEVENLEARLKMVEVAQTTSDYNFDDSQLARVKDVMAEIRSRLGVAEKLVNADTNFSGEITLEGPTPDNIVDQVTEHLQGESPKSATVAQKNVTQD